VGSLAASGSILLAFFLSSSAWASVQFQSFTEAANGANVTSITLATPAGTSAGDLLIVAVATDGATSSTLATALPGWVLLDSGLGAGAVTLGVWWKFASASEPSTHSFTWAGGEQVYAWMTRFTGHDPAAPIGAFSWNAGTSANPTSPSVTSTVANSLILRLGAFDDDDITVDATGLAGHTTIMDKRAAPGWGRHQAEPVTSFSRRRVRAARASSRSRHPGRTAHSRSLSFPRFRLRHRR
jgi:hypothetical protein